MNAPDAPQMSYYEIFSRPLPRYEPVRNLVLTPAQRIAIEYSQNVLDTDTPMPELAQHLLHRPISVLLSTQWNVIGEVKSALGIPHQPPQQIDVRLHKWPPPYSTS